MKKRLILVVIIAIVVVAAFMLIRHAAAGLSGDKKIISVDFDERVGEINALNGINNGPVSVALTNEKGDYIWNFDVTEIFKELKIPFVRTHDTEYPYGSDNFIDIHCIFPDFSKDPEDPESYNFTGTDSFIERVTASGAEPFFRLGESIDHSGKHLYINPPEDYEKWASVCEHIIRHYNNYWDKGFGYNIRYWEIWNEPEQGDMWTGSYEELFELYAVTAGHLKEKHPDIQVGGCAFTRPTEDMLRSFLEYIRDYDKEVPLDFLSWHCYFQKPGAVSSYAENARKLLDEYGYADTFSVLDEWNYIEDWNDQKSSVEFRMSQAGGAFIAEALMEMQYSNVDLAMYYDGQYQTADYFNGIYSVYRDKKPGYYSFDYFNRLRQLKNQVHTFFDTDGPVYALAASDGREKAVMLVNYSENAVNVKLECKGTAPVSIVHREEQCTEHPGGKSSTDLSVMGGYSFKMQPWEIMYITL